MDKARFDHLARTFAQTPSRRKFLGGLVAGLGGSLLSIVTGQAATCRAVGVSCSATRPCCSKNCVNGVCACAPGFTRCGANCRNLTNDEHNCGACGNACADESVPPPPSGGLVTPHKTTCCKGTCVDLDTDRQDCGKCGKRCVSDDKSCVAGICEYTGQSRCEEWGDCSPCDMFGDECTCGTTVEGTPTCLNSGQEPPFRHKPAEPGYPLPKACSRSSQCGPGSVCVGPTFCQSQYSEDQWYSDRAYCYRRCGVQDEWD